MHFGLCKFCKIFVNFLEQPCKANLSLLLMMGHQACVKTHKFPYLIKAMKPQGGIHIYLTFGIWVEEVSCLQSHYGQCGSRSPFKGQIRTNLSALIL